FTLPNMNLLGVEDAKGYISHCLEMSITYGLKKEEYLSHSVLSSLYEKYQDWEKALHHHKEYVSIKQLVHSKEIEESARNFDFGRRLQKMEEERSLELARLHQKESMLHDLLPGGISDRIINGEELVAELYQDIAIMFCDIVGFTEISERLGPESTIRSLNTFYTSFDSIIQKQGIEKIKTIGDCDMAASG
ncbi:MAG: adenylate/guanylate cyclase domain-containing protein, partial [Bacteroidota bacterium]